jgi:hypothetical protein
MAYAGKSGTTRDQRSMANSMSVNDSQPVGAIAAGLAIGLLVGAGAAFFLSPTSGPDLRRGLGRKLKRARWRGQDAWDALGHEFRSARRRIGRARRMAAEARDLG